jgi:hypothetical protein
MTDSASSREEPHGEYPPRFWWLKRIVAATTILALLLLVLQLWWGRSAETRLRAVTAQRRSSGDPASPEELSGAELKDSVNAAFYLQRAASKLSTRFDCPSDSNKITWNDAIFPYPPKWFAIEEAAAAADQAAFADLREARKHPRANWGQLHAPLTRISLPYLSRSRWLTNNACDDAMLLHFKGRDAEALEMIVDVLALADAVDQGPFVVSHLVADGIRADAAKHIQLIAPELRTDGSASATNREQVRQIIARMLDSSFRTKSAPRTFATQRVAQADLALASAQNEALLRPMFMLEAAWVLA